MMTGKSISNIHSLTPGLNSFCKVDDDVTSRETANTTKLLTVSEKIENCQVSWRESENSESCESPSPFLEDTPKIPEKDIQVMKLLGRGAFSDVRLGCMSDDPDQMFAIKRLTSSVLADPKALQICTNDLAMETAILSNLDHENIIHLHGVKQGNSANLLMNGNFFIVLDLLLETLHARLKRWKKQQKALSRTVDVNTTIKRLEEVAMGIVRGMEHLHEHRIIYRDLKPMNIGFDELYENVKIFDFGFARVLNEHNRMMTGGIGTPRYMAPEIARHDAKYGLPADVYSFSILLWQIVTTRTPFQEMTSASQLAAKVVMGNKRPRLRLVSSQGLRRLIEEGWSPNPAERPTFSEIRKRLEMIIKDHYSPSSNYDDANPRERRGSLRSALSFCKISESESSHCRSPPRERRSSLSGQLRRMRSSKSCASFTTKNSSNRPESVKSFCSLSKMSDSSCSKRNASLTPPRSSQNASLSPPRRRLTPPRRSKLSPTRLSPPPPDRRPSTTPSTPTTPTNEKKLETVQHQMPLTNPENFSDSMASIVIIGRETVQSIVLPRGSKGFSDSTDTVGSIGYATGSEGYSCTNVDATHAASSEMQFKDTAKTTGKAAPFYQRTTWKNKRRNSMF